MEPMTLMAALQGMDPEDETQWTADGSPRLDYLSDLTGVKVTRHEVLEMAPHFSRGAMDIEHEEEVADESPDTDIEPEDVEPLHTAREILRQMEARTADAHAAVEEAKAALIEAQKEEDAARDEANRLDPPMTNAQAIRNFINRSNAERARRAAARQKVLQHLPDHSIDPRMPIDRAFDRKTQLGGKRPTG